MPRRRGTRQQRESTLLTPRTFSYPRAAADPSAGRWFLIVLAAALAGACLMLSADVPAPLILPALSVCMVLAGFAMASVLYLAGLRMRRTLSSPWEVACALVFLGFAAAILGDASDAVVLLDVIYSGLAQ